MHAADTLVSAFLDVDPEWVFRELKRSTDWSNWLGMVREGNPDLTDDELIRMFIRDRLDNFYDEFLAKSSESHGLLHVFRCLSVHDPEAFAFEIASGVVDPKYKGVGIYWSWDRRRADCHWGSGGPLAKVYLVGRVHPRDVDIKQTLLLNADPDIGAEEAEVRLRPRAPVEVLGIAWRDPVDGAVEVSAEPGEGTVVPA